jgi:hypothetical protein
LLLEQLAHQPQGGPRIAPALNQHVENLALLVYRTRERYIRSPAIRTNHLIQMPSTARARATPLQPASDHWSEFQHPASDGLIGDVEPPLRKQTLDVAVA